LALDQESLPNHDLNDIFTNYLPAELTHEQYPNLNPEGSKAHTFANWALLVAYAWPENSPRYKRIAHFIDQLFGKIDEFHNAARHPNGKKSASRPKFREGPASRPRPTGSRLIKRA
jgi:uncharacterized protein